jgi:hypothetical protein
MAAPAQVSNMGLCEETVAALEARNIRALFPIQKHVFEPARAGRDLIGRARTGSGKTLAFALPVIENLLKVLPQQCPHASQTSRLHVLAAHELNGAVQPCWGGSHAHDGCAPPELLSWRQEAEFSHQRNSGVQGEDLFRGIFIYQDCAV